MRNRRVGNAQQKSAARDEEVMWADKVEAFVQGDEVEIKQVLQAQKEALDSI